MEKPIIIIGAGIAGLSLAFRLEEKNLPYLLIDQGNNVSSRVAAGIINPVVFRRMSLSWRIDELLPEAKIFYQNLETQLGGKYLAPIPIRRAFAHQQEVDLWLKKQDEENYSPYLKKLDEEDLNFKAINHGFGTGVVKNAFWIDTKSLLHDWHEKLKKEGKLITERVDYNAIDLRTKKYKDLEFDQLVFCEGYHGIYNPWFSYLPLEATKGELLTLKNDSMPENESYNYKCFVLPVGNNTFKLGATYHWNSPNTEISEEARQELEGYFKNLIASPYQITKQEAGVRPTVLDRRPLLGVHPKHEGLYIYNGLGAKGYLITPKVSEEFVDYLLGNKKLDKEVDIQRYESRLETTEA